MHLRVPACNIHRCREWTRGPEKTAQRVGSDFWTDTLLTDIRDFIHEIFENFNDLLAVVRLVGVTTGEIG